MKLAIISFLTLIFITVIKFVIYPFFRDRLIRRNGIKTVAEIINAKDEIEGDFGNQITSIPILKYYHEGKEIISKGEREYDNINIGSHVRIIYNSRNPKQFIYDPVKMKSTR